MFMALARQAGIVRRVALIPHIKFDYSQQAIMARALGLFGRAHHRAMAEFVNALAFEARRAMERNIQSRMTVRTSLKPFFSIKKASKAGASARVSAFVSTMNVKSASAPKTRFTGWQEQETGRRHIRERSHSLDARGGSPANKILNSARMKPSNRFRRIEKTKFAAMPYTQRVGRFLSYLQSIGYRKPFMLPTNSSGKKPIRHGIYRFTKWASNPKKGKMTRLVDLTEAPRQPRRQPIMKEPINRLLTPNFIRREFVKALKVEARRLGIDNRIRFFL